MCIYKLFYAIMKQHVVNIRSIYIDKQYILIFYFNVQRLKSSFN